MFAAGNFHSLVILEGGQLWSTGGNFQGQLGNGNTTNMNSFARVDLGEKKAIAVAAGGRHSLVILEGGQLWSTGWNNFGQLGLGNANKKKDMTSFAKVDLGERKAIAVAAGQAHSLVILEGGQLWSTGWNRAGQLGLGNDTDMTSFAKVDLGERKAIAVAAGQVHSLVILEGGQLWSTGYNLQGQLGLGNNTLMTSFARVDLGERKAIAVAAGHHHSLVILESGQLWSTGHNSYGQLGTGNNTDMTSFAKVDLGERKAIAVVATSHSLVILEGGQLWSTGWNNHGQLGLGNNTDMTSFAKVVFGERKAIAVATGEHHSLVILEGGQLWSTGRNYTGQLGNGNTTHMNSFAKVDLGERKAVVPLLAELKTMTVKQLKAKALELECDQQSIENADDLQDPKEAVIDLVVPKMQELLAKLEAMTVKELKQKALDIGRDKKTVDDVDDAAYPKKALIAMIMPKMQASPAPAASPPSTANSTAGNGGGCSQSASEPLAPSSDRKSNRWGDGLEAPAAGARPFFPTGWVPALSVSDSLKAFQKFGYNDEHIKTLMEAGHTKSEEVKDLDINIAPQHSSTIEAYTEEPGFYKDLNYTCRTPGKITDKKLESYRDYLYHSEQALSSLGSYVGETYRGTDNIMPDHLYEEGKIITYQQLTSSSKLQTVAKKFVDHNGKKLAGSMFIIISTTGKDIEAFSSIPEEKEILFKFNSHFKVERKIKDLDEKKQKLNDLSGYDLSDLDVYILQQI